MRREGHDAGEATADPDVQVNNVKQQQSMESALIGMEPASVPSYSSDQTGRSKTISAVFDLALMDVELFQSGEEQYVKNVV